MHHTLQGIRKYSTGLAKRAIVAFLGTSNRKGLDISSLKGGLIMTSNNLDEFVAESDRRGGPGHPDCESYWTNFFYVPQVVVDQTLDPYSDEYTAAQIRLYQEVSGRGLDQNVNEMTHFDLEAAVAATNAYNHPVPAELARHFQALSKVCRNANLPRGASILDMGCGWGLSSEIMAQMGFQISAVDINPLFVELVNRRAERLKYPVRATCASFDDFKPDRKYDLVLFYECLHHAVRPWELIRKLARSLSVSGSIFLAGEPINQIWWKNWGLRLDALSVYCIRKYGWFESGWSLAFITDMLTRCGLVVRVIQDSDSHIGPVVSGSLNDTIFAKDLSESASVDGWDAEGQYLICRGCSALRFSGQLNAREVILKIKCFRPKPLVLVITCDGEQSVQASLAPGENLITVPLRRGVSELGFMSDTWIPDKEIHNGDQRKLAFHLEALRVIFCD